MATNITSNNQSANPFLLQVAEQKRSQSIKSQPACLTQSGQKLLHNKIIRNNDDITDLNYTESIGSSNMRQVTPDGHPMRTQTFNRNQNKEQQKAQIMQHMDTAMLVENNQSSVSQRLMLVYADSSDEDNENNFQEEDEQASQIDNVNDITGLNIDADAAETMFSRTLNDSAAADLLEVQSALKSTKYKLDSTGKGGTSSMKRNSIATISSKQQKLLLLAENSITEEQFDEDEPTSPNFPKERDHNKMNDRQMTSVKKNQDLIVETATPQQSMTRYENGNNLKPTDEETGGLTLESPTSAITFLDKRDAAQARLVSQKTVIDKAKDGLEKTELVGLDAGGSVYANQSKKGGAKIDTITEFESQDIEDTSIEKSKAAFSSRRASVGAASSNMQVQFENNNEQNDKSKAQPLSLVKRGTYNCRGCSFKKFHEDQATPDATETNESPSNGKQNEKTSSAKKTDTQSITKVDDDQSRQEPNLQIPAAKDSIVNNEEETKKFQDTSQQTDCMDSQSFTAVQRKDTEKRMKQNTTVEGTAPSNSNSNASASATQQVQDINTKACEMVAEVDATQIGILKSQISLQSDQKSQLKDCSTPSLQQHTQENHPPVSSSANNLQKQQQVLQQQQRQQQSRGGETPFQASRCSDQLQPTPQRLPQNIHNVPVLPLQTSPGSLYNLADYQQRQTSDLKDFSILNDSQQHMINLQMANATNYGTTSPPLGNHLAQPLLQYPQMISSQQMREQPIFSPMVLTPASAQLSEQQYVAISRNGLISPQSQQRQSYMLEQMGSSSFMAMSDVGVNQPLSAAEYQQLQGGGIQDSRLFSSTHKMATRFEQSMLEDQARDVQMMSRPKSGCVSRQSRKILTQSANNETGASNASQFMFQGAEAGAKPKRVRPTTAAQNVKLLNRANTVKGGGRETIFSNIEVEYKSPRCSRERCRDLIKQQLLLKQQTRQRRGMQQSQQLSSKQLQQAKFGQLRQSHNYTSGSMNNQQSRRSNSRLGKTQMQIEKDEKMTKAYGSSSQLPSNADIEITLTKQNHKLPSPSKQEGRSSYRKLRMLPWCRDERDEIVHTEYIRFLAQMDSQSRSKAAKHAIVAASSLLKSRRGLSTKSQKSRDSLARGAATVSGAQEQRKVAWHEQTN